MENLNHAPSYSWGIWWSSSCILLLTIMHSFSPSSANSPGNATDRIALLDIKNQMYDPTGFMDSWNDSKHHCQWSGVSCDMRYQRVTNLSLRGKSFSGTISAHIGNLSFMKGIHLEENSLRGGIPQQISQLSELRFFNLSYNVLSGEIPVNLTRCSRLKHIDLIGNNLTGKIPAQLGSLTKLEFLYLADNNLVGRIPASITNLSTSVINIALGYNSLEGYVPNGLGSFGRLNFLGLGPNKLRGEIPSSLFNMSTLTYLVVVGNLLSGKLPTNIGLNLPNLQTLEMGANLFTGEIPVSVTNCTNLRILDFGNNKLEGKIPPSVGQLLNLEHLNLQQNSLNGNVMDFLVPLTNSTNLMILFLSYNNFSGGLTNSIGNLSTHLYHLYLANSKISGTIPVEIGNLVRLEGLALASNYLSGVIPANLAKLQNLKALTLGLNRLFGEIPPSLCNNITNLFDLELYYNNLGGDLSHSLANCQSLQKLFVEGNRLSGIIPSQIFGSYISPTELSLRSNAVSGTLPLEVGKLANLQYLDVSHNKLSGRIPSTIGDCLVIEFVYMQSNNFSGSLPSSLASLKGIEHLDLSDNNLTGEIPGGLNQLIYLKYLNISYNDLEGEVPIDGVFSNASQIMLQGNSKLCGGISELRLSACPIVHQKTKGKKHLKIILIPLLSVLVLSITLSLCLYLHQKSDRVRKRMPMLQPTKDMLRVSYHSLFSATSEFSPANLIGTGSFGFVYKGSLALEHGEIKVVAVKVLDLQKRGASKSFMAECDALSNLRHRNLLPILTYCSSIDHKGDEFKALVYKYMENGSLDTWLHPDRALEPPPRCLDLLQRLNIAVDVASALDHLHNHSHIAVAHCDVKPSNILLDDELTAYVGDFGLARLLPQLQDGASSSSTIAIKGTIGYVAPEYGMGMEVSTQGDVYSYGIMLLEMLTGKRPTDDAFTEDLDLHDYVETGLFDRVWEIVDRSLLSKEEPQAETGLKAQDCQECIISTLKLGVKCSKRAVKNRMDMKQVTRELHFIRDAFCVA